MDELRRDTEMSFFSVFPCFVLLSVCVCTLSFVISLIFLTQQMCSIVDKTEKQNKTKYTIVLTATTDFGQDVRLRAHRPRRNPCERMHSLSGTGDLYRNLPSIVSAHLICFF